MAVTRLGVGSIQDGVRRSVSGRMSTSSSVILRAGDEDIDPEIAKFLEERSALDAGKSNLWSSQVARRCYEDSPLLDAAFFTKALPCVV